MNRHLSVKEVVALFEKFIEGLADGDIEKIVGTPTKSRRQEKVEELAKLLHNARHMSCGMSESEANKNWNQHTPESQRKVWGGVAEAALGWVGKQLSKQATSKEFIHEGGEYIYNQALSDVRKHLGLDS